MKFDPIHRERIAKDPNLKKVIEKIDRWKRIKKGDAAALIETMIECGMAKKENFS